MKAPSHVTTLLGTPTPATEQQPSGLWISTIRTGHERLDNEMEFTNRGHSRRNAEHRANILRQRVMAMAAAMTCGCESCAEEFKFDPDLFYADDCVLGKARIYEREGFKPSRLLIPNTKKNH